MAILYECLYCYGKINNKAESIITHPECVKELYDREDKGLCIACGASKAVTHEGYNYTGERKIMLFCNSCADNPRWKNFSGK